MQKRINLYKMKQKQEDTEKKHGKKGNKSHFGYKFHNIMYRDCELIKRFKTAI